MGPRPERPQAPPVPPGSTPPSLAEAARVWARIGWLGFGGPAGQIALMHDELVERRRWLDEERFLHALNFCMLLPGPEATQLAVYVGWLQHGTRGGLIAGTLFVLPGFLAILALSLLYASMRHVPAVAGALFGLKAAVLAIVIQAVVRIGRRALRHPFLVGVAAAAFGALFLFKVPFPFVVAGAGLLGVLGARVVPAAFPEATVGPAATPAAALPSPGRVLRVLAIGCALWIAPVLVLATIFGAGSIFVTEGVFFSKAAVVTFGGAYAVLAYLAQRAVETYGWLSASEMVDGLGLAETTPGPLIMVVQFVAYLGAARAPGGLPPMVAGVIGSLVTVWVTFVPCFLWIFLFAPYLEALRANRRLRSALAAITAAVVGVILNLSIWFGAHVLFHDGSVDVASVALAALALALLVHGKLGLPRTLATIALLGVGATLVG